MGDVDRDADRAFVVIAMSLQKIQTGLLNVLDEARCRVDPQFLAQEIDRLS